MRICPCCERKVKGITEHKDPVCELERGNIKDVETLHKLIDKYFTSDAEFIDDECQEYHVPCMCCFYRDIKHFIDVENAVNQIKEGDLNYEASA